MLRLNTINMIIAIPKAQALMTNFYCQKHHIPHHHHMPTPLGKVFEGV